MLRPKDKNNDFQVKDEAFVEDGLMINSSFLDGLKTPGEAIEKSIDYLTKIN